MEGRNIEGVSTTTRPAQGKPAWTGITVGDAVFSEVAKIDHDTPSALATATHLAEGPANQPAAIQFSGNWRGLQGSEPGYLAITGWDGSLKLVEWPRLDQPAKAAILAALARHPILTYDGMDVVECFLDAGVLVPGSLMCMKTMATLLENQAHPGRRKKSKISYEPADVLARYGFQGTGYTNLVTRLPGLAAKLTAEIIHADLQAVMSLEHRLMPVTHQMQRAGLGIDRQGMEAVLQAASESASKAAEEVKVLLGRPGLNLNNSDELLETLAGAGITVDSTKVEELMRVDHPVARAIVKYKESTTILNDATKCLEGASQDGRVRAEWDALGAGTGRMTCGNPCLQSVKGDMNFRRCIIPASGYVYIRCDYAQADLRAIAFKAQDPALTAALAPDRDFHQLTAAKLLGKGPQSVTPDERNLSKTIVFGIAYIMTPESLAKQARLKLGQDWTRGDAQEFTTRLFTTYPGLKAYYEELRQAAEAATECRTILYRRRRLLPPGPEHTMYRFRRMLNMMAQGTVADALKEATIGIASQLGSAGAIILNLHDELVLEVAESCAPEVALLVQQAMEAALSRAIPGIPVKAEVRICRTLAG